MSENLTCAGLCVKGLQEQAPDFQLVSDNLRRWHMPCLLNGAMKGYVICALAAIGLALNAEAAPKDREKDKPPVIVIPKDKDKGPVYSVPHSGSTALLLGTGLLVLGTASRRFTTR